ncbi:uncharacterized protein LOC113271978 [Papaver somniferum]|uniref:uncharacterized protein LOC113271978 n=1 Tax=Papaver somniferum TaxID=3469 RepID=UPI000E700DE6|nr:uncharacterized protein LOC113271978 [Papaver somniferum]
MKNCYEDTRLSVIVNGVATGFYKGSRGLRQGDLLSQFLFLMVAEVFSALMKKAERNGLISGFKVKSNGTPITHLQFADHTIVFLDANPAQFTALKQILIELQQITGLNTNLEKSSVIGVGDAASNCDKCARVLGCEVGSLPINYLGLPIGSSSRRISIWDPVIDRLKKRLASWKRQYLSKGGRLILLKSVLRSMPIYYLSLFAIPASIANTLEKIMRNFL